MQQLGPGFVVRQMIPCHSCRGRGEIIDGKKCVLNNFNIIFMLEKKRCSVCYGEKVVSDKKILEVCG